MDGMVRGEDRGAVTTDRVLNQLLGISHTTPIHTSAGRRVDMNLGSRIGWEPVVPGSSISSTIKPGGLVHTVSAAGSSLVSPGVALKGAVPLGGGATIHSSLPLPQVSYNSMAGMARVGVESQSTTARTATAAVFTTHSNLGGLG